MWINSRGDVHRILLVSGIEYLLVLYRSSINNSASIAEQTLPLPSNDPLPSGKDSPKLKELIDLCTNLSNKVIELESEVIDIKTTYQERIEKLEGKVERLEEENRVLKELKSTHSTDDAAEPIMEKGKSSKQGRKIADINADVEINLEKAQAKAYNLDFDHQEKVLSMMDINEEESADVDEVLEVVKAAKLMTEVVTTAGATKVSVLRKRRGFIIQDLEEKTTATVQPKRKPLTQAQAKRYMIVYLKNMVGFKMDYFKGMTYDEIRPLFEKHYNYNQTFLDEESAKKQKMKEETEELNKHLQIVTDDVIDVYTNATPLASKIPITDYKIHAKRNRPCFNYQMSAKDKSGLGSSDVEDSHVNDRFVKVEGTHVVPLPMTRNYMPPKSDFGIDDSKFTYGLKQSTTSETNAKTSDLNSCDSNSSVETLKSVPKLVANKPKAVSEPKVWSDAPIIEEYESDNDDEHVTIPSKEQKKPSFAFVNTVEHDNPHQTLKGKGIVDSGCSRHMTGNKAYLIDYQDFNGGPVAFGGSKGRITGKGKIKIRELDFEDVYFVKELHHFNLFFMSQMCDKKNKVLFIDTKCLVLSTDFKFPNENQVLLRVPRHHNMYSFNLENIIPSGSLACLIAKAIVDEFTKWHRSLGMFAEKSDEGFLVGYSLSIKVFRVYNLKTKRVEENLHINFLENKPNVAGKGPTWLFDLDYLTNSINYHPITAENKANSTAGLKKTNNSAGAQDDFDARNSDMDANHAQEYYVLPLWSSYTSTIKSSNANNGDEKFHEDNDSTTNKKPVDKEDKPFWRSLKGLKDKKKRLMITPVNAASTLTNQDDLRIPALEDIYDHSRDKSWCDEFKALMKNRFQMSSIGKLTFFLGLQVKQKEDGIFISQDKYVTEILKNFDFLSLKTVSTPIETNRPLVKDEEAADVDFVLVLGFRESVFDLEAYSDSDYAGANLDRKSTTGEKPTESEGFAQIIDFLNASSVMYALTASPTIYTSCIKQFQTSAKVQTVNDEVRIQALTDSKRVNIKESSIRRTLRLDDAEEAGVPFFMCPRFVQLIINHQLGDMAHHKEIFDTPSLTKKVFANMKRVGTGFSREVTSLFDTMLVQALKEVAEQTLPSPSNDLLPSGKDSLKLKELIDLCTNLSNKVLELESEVIDIKSTYQEKIEKIKGMIERLEEENMVLKELKREEIADIDADIEINSEKYQAEAYNLDLDHQEKVLSMMDVNEEEPTDVEQVLEVFKATKLMTEVVTTTGATKVSVPRKKRGVIIQDPKETTTATVKPKVDEFDLEEMDLKWQVVMISTRLKKFYKKTRRKLHFDAKEPVGFDKRKLECFNCHNTRHFARECRSKGNQDSRRRDVGNTRYKERENGKRPTKQDERKSMVTINGEGSDTKISTKDKSGLGSSDVEDSIVNDRFVKVKGMHVVPPPMTGNYIPPKSNFGIDESKFSYGPKQSTTSESNAKTSDLDSCDSNSSVETLKSVPKPVTNKPKAVSEPKVWSNAPIIEEYESDNDGEHVTIPSKEQEKPSFTFVNTVEHVKTHRQTVKEQNTCSQNPKPKNRDTNGLMSKRIGLGYGFTKKAYFGKRTGTRENRPVWNNVQRLNHQNKFVPTAVLTKTCRFPVNAARQNFTSQAALISIARKVNTARPKVNEIRPRHNVYKSHSPIRRAFYKTTASKVYFAHHKVNTARDKSGSAVGGEWENVVKASKGCNWRYKRYYWNRVSKYNRGSKSRKYVDIKDPLARLKSEMAWVSKRN
nr:ribonuclease H-like domain-containing protein [Tanacetum cinerariifolium]